MGGVFCFRQNVSRYSPEVTEIGRTIYIYTALSFHPKCSRFDLAGGGLAKKVTRVDNN